MTPRERNDVPFWVEPPERTSCSGRPPRFDDGPATLGKEPKCPNRSPTSRPTSTTPTRSGSPTRSRSGTSCAPAAPWPTAIATAAPGCPSATTTSPRSPTTPSTSRRGVVMSYGRPTTPGPDGHRPAHHVRPALPPRGAAVAATGVLAARRRHARAVHPRRCEELLDAVGGADEFDAAADYAQHIPLRVIVKMLGFPQEDADIFRRFIRTCSRTSTCSAEERQATSSRLDRLHQRPHRRAPRTRRTT